MFTDESFMKLFRLAQLTLEYLLNVQSTLYSYSSSMEKKVSNLNQEASDARHRMERLDDAMKNMKRELRQKKRTIRTYEYLLAQQRSKEFPIPAPVPASAMNQAQDDPESKTQPEVERAPEPEPEREPKREEEMYTPADIDDIVSKRVADERKALEEKLQQDLERERASLRDAEEKAREATKALEKERSEFSADRTMEMTQKVVVDVSASRDDPARQSWAGAITSDNEEGDTVDDGEEASSAHGSSRQRQGRLARLEAELELERQRTVELQAELAASEREQIRIEREQLEKERRRLEELASSSKKIQKPTAVVDNRVDVPTPISPATTLASAKRFAPTYEWSTLPSYYASNLSMLPPGLEYSSESPPLCCRIPPSWMLKARVSGKRSGTLALPVRRTMSMRELCIASARALGVSSDAVSVSRKGKSGALLRLADAMTVEEADLFARPPTITIVGELPTADVQDIVKRYCNADASSGGRNRQAITEMATTFEAMPNVQEFIAKRSAEAQISPRAMPFAPLESRPYVRAQFDHNERDVRRMRERVQASIDDKRSEKVRAINRSADSALQAERLRRSREIEESAGGVLALHRIAQKQREAAATSPLPTSVGEDLVDASSRVEPEGKEAGGNSDLQLTKSADKDSPYASIRSGDDDGNAAPKKVQEKPKEKKEQIVKPKKDAKDWKSYAEQVRRTADADRMADARRVVHGMHIQGFTSTLFGHNGAVLVAPQSLLDDGLSTVPTEMSGDTTLDLDDANHASRISETSVGALADLYVAGSRGGIVSDVRDSVETMVSELEKSLDVSAILDDLDDD